MSTPLRAVLRALEDGARSREAVVSATGLSYDIVDGALDHLVRLGRVDVTELSSGCPSGGCGSCPSGHGTAPGCGAAAPLPHRPGRGLVGLSLRRPN